MKGETGHPSRTSFCPLHDHLPPAARPKPIWPASLYRLAQLSRLDSGANEDVESAACQEGCLRRLKSKRLQAKRAVMEVAGRRLALLVKCIAPKGSHMKVWNWKRPLAVSEELEEGALHPSARARRPRGRPGVGLGLRRSLLRGAPGL